jgi:hypothetical protein
MPPKRKVAPSEVFLSHSTKNDVFIGRLQTVLSDYGVKTFVSKTSIRGAQQWHDEIGTALKRCGWFLLVLSPQSVHSAWVKHDLIYALQANRYRGRIIPVVYKNCDKEALSWTLPAIECVDFRSDFDEGCRQLLDIWHLEYKRRP